MTAKVCTFSELQDRFHLALNRARRNKKLVLLLLVRLRTAGNDEYLKSRLPTLAIRRVGTCLRSSDSVCLYSNCELAVLMEDVREHAQVPSVIEKLHSTFTHPISSGSAQISLLPSYGASVYPVDGHETGELWQRAQEALGSACCSEPGSFRLSPGMAAHGLMDRFELDRDVHQAYQQQAFRLVYQPVFTADEKRVCAIEAFIRWDHPRRGALLPESFLHLLEESGLIVPVGERILRETCLFARTLLDRGHKGIRVCVNISGRQLSDPAFLLGALDALYDAQLDPSLLQLEFSENTLTGVTDATLRLLQDIRKARIQIAVDHFGSGNSSLAELVQLPISLVKIDRLLVAKVSDDPVSNAIISGIFALAQDTGLEVAAVGIEAAGQIDVLSDMGCKEVQGNYLADAFSDGDLGPWLPN
jgi:EAL domain-containing protein (putative c-di-GMP-specific phosphodiesterase class I)/GGDEF domain-containing protein